jgi:3-oxoacyl-[acyl-carrier-protein] synthase II
MLASSPISPTIAVTALAWRTPLGDDLDGVFQRLCAGETGIREVSHEVKLRSGLAAVVPDEPLDAPAAARMTALGLPALRRALAAAGISGSDPDLQLVLGTSLGAFLEGEPESAPLHAWADALGRAVSAARAPIAISTACSSGSDAILVGAEMIRAGVAERCVCGGVDVLTISKRLAHSALGTLSPTMLRAFDARHDGTLLGEGAGFVVLEKMRDDRAPLAILRGVGAANDAAGMTTPDLSGLGARLALTRSLADAGIEAGAIGVINAHGSGTPLNDATEAIAFREVFGDARSFDARGLRPDKPGYAPEPPIVFGTKGNFGHSLGATGALEAIAVILALRAGRVPPVVGLEQPDPEMRFPLPQGEPLATSARFGLSLTLGFGGFDSSLIFEVPR